MNNLELQALRKLFMLDVSEAAEFIGKVSPRSWQYWEAGRSLVPQDVSNQMTDYAQIRDDLLARRLEQCIPDERIKLNFYQNIDEFEATTGKRNVVMWRLTQSVAAQLYAEGLAELVKSDGLTI